MTSLDICLIQWTTLNNRMQKLLDTIPENNFSKPIVSGGNSPSWLLGHLVDTDDSLLELFGIRQRLYPEMKAIYNHERGANQSGHLSKPELISKWKDITAELD